MRLWVNAVAVMVTVTSVILAARIGRSPPSACTVRMTQCWIGKVSVAAAKDQMVHRIDIGAKFAAPRAWVPTTT